MNLMGAALIAALLVAIGAGCGGVDGQTGSAVRASNGWSRLPDAPLSPRDHAVVVGVGDRMLVVGGWEFLCPPGADCSTPEGPLLRDGAVYDPASNSWTRVTEPPFGVRRAEFATTALDGWAYLLTGCADGPACDARPRLLSYDLADDRWTDHGAVPGPERHRHLTTWGESLLAYSSSDEHREAADLVYDPRSATWEELPDDPLPSTFDRFVVAAEDDLVLAGSSRAALDSGESSPKLAARFDMATGEWTTLPQAPGPGYQLFPSDDGPLLNAHYFESPGAVLDTGSWTWSELPEGPEEYDDLSGVLGEDRATYDVYSIGGSELLLYDTAGGRFLTLTAPSGREEVYDDSTAALGRDLFVYGGQRWRGDALDGEGELLGDAWLWRAPTGN